jgi:hypothetical protein
VKISNLYILTLSFILTHQIDAAYWHEWEMFKLPGGITFFNLFNLILVPFLLLGLVRVVLQQPSAYRYSLCVSILGILVFLIHTSFYVFGFEQFNLPISIAIIVGNGVLGVLQLYYTVKFREYFDTHLTNASS